MEDLPDHLSVIDGNDQGEHINAEEVDYAHDEEVILKDCEIDEGSGSGSGTGTEETEQYDGENDADVEKDAEVAAVEEKEEEEEDGDEEEEEEEEGEGGEEGDEEEEENEKEENDFAEGADDMNQDEGDVNVGDDQEEKQEADEKEGVEGEAEPAEEKVAEQENKEEESAKVADDVDSNAAVAAAADDVGNVTDVADAADAGLNDTSAKEGKGVEQTKWQPAEQKPTEPGQVNYAYIKPKGDTVFMNVCNPKNINLTDIQTNKETNKHILFPSLSPTDIPVPGREKENITMLHMDPEKCGYKYSSGVNPAEGYLFVYPHVSNNAIPPKIRKKRSVCC